MGDSQLPKTETKTPMPKVKSGREIMKFFKYDHLPERLANISQPFCDLASMIDGALPVNDESTVALRKLLEAKDAAVRATL